MKKKLQTGWRERAGNKTMNDLQKKKDKGKE